MERLTSRDATGKAIPNKGLCGTTDLEILEHLAAYEDTGLVSGKQPMSLQLTSGSGELTFFEVTLWVQPGGGELGPAVLQLLYHGHL